MTMQKLAFVWRRDRNACEGHALRHTPPKILRFDQRIIEYSPFFMLYHSSNRAPE